MNQYFIIKSGNASRFPKNASGHKGILKGKVAPSIAGKLYLEMVVGL